MLHKSIEMGVQKGFTLQSHLHVPPSIPLCISLHQASPSTLTDAPHSPVWLPGLQVWKGKTQQNDQKHPDKLNRLSIRHALLFFSSFLSSLLLAFTFYTPTPLSQSVSPVNLSQTDLVSLPHPLFLSITMWRSHQRLFTLCLLLSSTLSLSSICNHTPLPLSIFRPPPGSVAPSCWVYN